MTEHAILEVMDHLDPALIEQADVKKVRKPSRPARVAVIAACMCLLVVGAAFAASAGMRYGMWARAVSEIDGVKFPKQLGEFSLAGTREFYVVPDGVSFDDAPLSAVYRPAEFSYVSGGGLPDGRRLTVDVGKTDPAYWSVYFSFDPETLEFIPGENDRDLRAVETRGRTVYLYDSEYPDGELVTHSAVWLEPERGLCISLSLQGGPEALPDGVMPCVELVMDLFR